MKKLLLLLLSIFTIALNAQTPKYSRVLIKGDVKVLMPKLASIGYLPDHDHISNNGIITEISEDELTLLQNNSIEFEVLINDMTKFYVERNQAVLKATASNTNCNMPAIKIPTHFHLGTMGGYFKYNEMLNMIDSMALVYPNLITVKQAAGGVQSIEGRNIWYVKISDNPTVDENEPEVLYTALHHAREAQSLSQLIFYMWYLLENYNTNNEIKGLVDNTEMFFIPCVNPDGYIYNETNSPNGGGMWRKNRRVNGGGTFGVDLNRNYGYNWGYDNFGSSPNGGSDTYRGASAFSEPEIQAVRNFCNARQFKAAINAHTFGNHLIYPWGYIPSLLTADSLRFNAWGEYLTEKSAYSYGTCDQTLFYITNGSSDDWMYGEQNTKSKIYAFTPETGSAFDGFWPASNRILDLCKFTLYQNINTAKLAGTCFKIEDKTDHFMPPNGHIKFGVSNLGLSGTTATVSVQALNNAFTSFNPTKIITALSPLQNTIDSIPFSMNSSVQPGQKIRYTIQVNTGTYVQSDTITKMIGLPQTVFYDNGNNLNNNFIQNGTWVNTQSSFVSPPSSIADSPGLYGGAEDKSISFNQAVDLSNAIYAHLQYFTKFDIEKFFDNAQILISTDNGSTFDALCTPFQTAPREYDGTEPIYDYRHDKWIKEEVDLSNYLGMGIVLKFTLQTDNGNNKDGIYLDDILIRKLVVPTNTTALNNLNYSNSSFLIYPNPNTGNFQINTNKLNSSIKIFNNIGVCVFDYETSNKSTQINLSHLPAGIYFVTCNNGSAQKLVIEH